MGLTTSPPCHAWHVTPGGCWAWPSYGRRRMPRSQAPKFSLSRHMDMDEICDFTRDNIKTWESVRFYFVLSFFNLRIFSEHVSFGHKWRIYLGEHVNRCSQSNLRMLPKESQCQPWFVRCIYPQERSFTWAVNHPFSTDKSVWTIGWMGWWWLILPAGLTLVSSWVVSEHVLANRNSWLTS